MSEYKKTRTDKVTEWIFSTPLWLGVTLFCVAQAVMLYYNVFVIH